MEEQAVWLWSPWSSRWKWTEVPLGRQPDTSFLNVPIVHNTWLYPDQKSSRILFGFKTQGGTKRNWDDSYHLIYPLPVHSTTHMCTHAHTHTYMYTHTHTHTHTEAVVARIWLLDSNRSGFQKQFCDVLNICSWTTCLTFSEFPFLLH